MSETLTIPRRFNGPPDSGHGGWSSGAVARLCEVPVAVELRAPPPLDLPLAVTRHDDGRVEVHDSETLVARGVPSEPPRVRAPEIVDVDRALAASDGYPGFDEHVFPTCWACGPDRSVGDGLRIFPGPVADSDMWAAVWQPTLTESEDGETVAEVQVWAALDCPSGWPAMAGQGPAVLARLQATQAVPIPVTEPVVAIGWAGEPDGRKLPSASALLSVDGRVLATATALWIRVEL